MVRTSEFRAVCHRHGLAATHQRQLIYETVMSIHGHPSPEDVFEEVRKNIPSISLGTVYKNIRTFLDSGLLREVSVHHGTLHVEANHRPHQHFVCSNCKTIVDLPEEEFDSLQLHRQLPRGFEIQKFVVDVVGLCPKCSTQRKSFQNPRRHRNARSR